MVCRWLTSLILAGLFLSISFPAWAVNRALLVAIDAYCQSNLNLKGCENDIRDIRKVLIDRMGFSVEHIVILKNQEATRQSILSTLQWISAATGPGDDFVFYYSGHGSHLKDQDGDEEDGWDETICPHDTDPRDGTNMIRDDELRPLFESIRAKRQLLFFDSCHSGTITRTLDDSVLWESALIKYIPPLAFERATTRDGPPVFRTLEARDLPSPSMRSPASGAAYRDIRATPDMADVSSKAIVFTAARADQKAVSTQIGEEYHGVMTYYLARGLMGEADLNQDGHLTYLELVDYVRREAKHHSPQQIQLDGPPEELRKDILVLPGASPRPEPLEEIISLQGERSDFRVEVWVTEPGKRVFRYGEKIYFSVRSERSGYLTLLNIDGTGQVTVIFPNSFHREAWIEADQIVTIPAPYYEFDFEAQAPGGKESVIAVVTTQDVVPAKVTQRRAGEIFRSVSRDHSPDLFREMNLRLRGIGVKKRPKKISTTASSRLEWSVSSVQLEVRP